MSAPKNNVAGEWADETGIVVRGAVNAERSGMQDAPAAVQYTADPGLDPAADLAVDPAVEPLAASAARPSRSPALDLTASPAVDRTAGSPDDLIIEGAGPESCERRQAFDAASLDDTEGEDTLDPVADASRVENIWREWLLALASDSEAAIGAAMTYRQFPDDVRDEWVSALESDTGTTPVSRVAVFAPLLAVETDPNRRLRIAQLLQPGLSEVSPSGGEQYYRVRLESGAVVASIVSPLYLEFVQVLACCHIPGERFLWVRHDPIAHKDRCESSREALAGVRLEVTPRHVVVDELAQTVVAAHRRRECLPEPLCLFAHLFTPGY
jgi:hypothetical protein